jgi:small-conductance mechanosensitive channel/CRP-like cAMP-binding protein
MTVWLATLAEARSDWPTALLAAFIVVLLLVRLAAPHETVRLKGALACLGLHVVLLPVAGILLVEQSPGYRDVRFVVLIFEAFAIIGVTAILAFSALLPRIGVHLPEIVRDVLVAAAAIVAIFSLGSRAGLNLSGLIATSTVLTAIVGLSLQDTLGNVMAGMALQLDRSVRVGDWIKLGELNGLVREIRWRSTSIETRNWETMVIPNSMLVRNQFLVLGQRTGRPLRWRRWVYFNVDFRFVPGDVIAAVTEAARAAPIDRVASDPPPDCLLMEFHESYGRYAVRYWLTDLACDDPTDSAMRTRIYFALKRAAIPLSIPAHAIFVTEESQERKVAKSQDEKARRREALGRVDLFDHLSQEDRDHLAASLRYAPFSNGEIMTRQGAEAHWLYMIIEGDAAVSVSGPDQTQNEVARLHRGNFFGEISLMTGAPRSATVVALTNVECYRLDQAAFRELVRERPGLAEGVAEVLAKRSVALEAVKENLDAEARSHRLALAKQNLLARIQEFFGLAAEEASNGHGPAL